MTKYNILNVKLFNSRLNKLKSGIQNGTEVEVTGTGLEPTTTKFVNENSTIQPNWPSD